MPNEAAQLFMSKRSKEEILNYLLLFGGIPKYLEEINLNQSLRQNMNRLCFNPKGFIFNEPEKIFFQQFNEARSYLKIAKSLKDANYTFKEISKKANISYGGGLKKYLDNLEKAQIVSSYNSFDAKLNSKTRKYALTDELLVFYYKFIEPNKASIKKQLSNKLFESLCESKWKPLLGYAFERFCLKNAAYLAKIMGFSDDVVACAPYFGKNGAKFQIDLVFKRADKVITICEIKYHDNQIGTQVIKEVMKKTEQFPLPKGYSLETALISVHGANKALKDSGYFHHMITVSDLIT